MCEYSGGKPQCAMKVHRWDLRGTIGRFAGHGPRAASEQICWDPKDGELCLGRAKPGETLVEARSDSDVQIDRQTWV